ncbi:MAG: SecE/sec61-gamma family protein translocase subunit [Candidatus Hodarchaeales archaeon]
MSSNTGRLTTANFYKRMVRILRLATKPKRSEIFLIVKISITGISILGLLAFVIRILLFTILGRQDEL